MPLSDDPALRRAIFEHARDAMLLIDVGSRVLDVNLAALELLGATRDELLGRDACALFAATDRAECERQIASGDSAGEVRVQRPRGETRWAEMVVTRDIVAGCHLLVVRDRSEQREHESEAERYRILWHRTRDLVIFVGQDGRIIDANDAAVDAYGPRERLVRMHVGQLRAPDTRPTIPGQLEQAFAEGVVFETVHLRGDGTPMPVEVSSRRATIGGESVLLSVIRDVSERKQMLARLVESDRLASVGTLAAGVAHEINNPLAYVMTSVELALRAVRRAGEGSTTALAQAAELLSTALHGAERVSAIVRDLKTLARTDDEETAVDVRAVIDACLDVAQHELRQRVSLVRRYGEVPLVSANEGRLAQVFLNLIVNAAHAVRAAGRERGTVQITTSIDARGRVVVEVTDDGTGIDPAIMPHIFDAFVTTKRAGEGTGLGLYLSRSIVHGLGGELHARSELGRGSTFVVSLGAGVPARPTLPKSIEIPVTSRRARVLLVDDEISIGAVLRAALEEEHELIVLTSAEAAIEWLGRDDGFDLILTDVSMHGLSGLDLLAHLRAHLPALVSRVVMMSGGALPSGVPESALDGVPLLAKPFSIDTLRRAIGAALARIDGHDPPANEAVDDQSAAKRST